MKFRTTLIAALLLALFGAYVYFFEYKKAKEEEEREKDAKKVFSLDWEKLEGMKIKDSHGSFVIEKIVKEAGKGDDALVSPEVWRILEPVRTEADSSTLNSIVSTLKNLEVEQVVSESPEDLAAFGLDQPGLEIEMLVSEGEDGPPGLRVGSKSPVGQNSYARKQGEDKVLLLSTYLNTQIDKSLFDLREKKLFKFTNNDVEKVRVLREGKLQLEINREDGQWRITHPIRAKAAETEVNKILNKLTGLRAQSFAAEQAENLSPYGLENPQWEVDVSLAPDHSRASLLLGAQADKEGASLVYAKRGEIPPVVSLKKELIQAIDVKPEALREKKLFPFQSWKVEKADLDLNGQHITLEKKGAGKWWISDPLEARASSGKISPFLSSLSRLEGEEFIDMPGDEGALASYGLDAPMARITLFEEDETAGEGEQGEKGLSRLGTLLVARAPGDSGPCYAMLEGSDTLARVGEDFLEKDLPKDLESLREKKLLDFQRYQVSSIECDGPEGEVILSKRKGKWNLEEPDSRALEERVVNDLLGLLAELEVDRFVGKTGNGSADAGSLQGLGLEPPERRVTLENEEGVELGTLLVSEKGPESEEGFLYVQQKGDPWIGLLMEEKENLLSDKLKPFLNK